jgi:hypothetical protein
MPDFNIIVNSSEPLGIRYQVPTKTSKVFKLGTGALDSQRLSYLGTPIVSDLELSAYRPLQDPYRFKIDAVIIEVSQTKNIVTTAVTNRSGTIKEYIADGDYDIRIRGAIVDTSGAFPEAEIRKLIQLLQLPQVITPTSDYLRLFDIHQMVVTSFSFSQREGVQNVQYFEISALSDTPEQLIIDA